MNQERLAVIEVHCVRCRSTVAPEAITCLQCGWILGKGAFAAIQPDSLSEVERAAFARGYQDCQQRWNAEVAQHQARRKQGEMSEETTPSPSDLIRAGYDPVRPYETAYRAGWEKAVEELLAQESKKKGRRKGLFRVGVGLTLLTMALTGYGLFHLFGFTSAVLRYWLLTTLCLFLPLLRLLYVQFSRQRQQFNWRSFWQMGMFCGGVLLTWRLEQWVMEYLLVGAGMIFGVIGAMGAGVLLLGLLMIVTGESDE